MYSEDSDVVDPAMIYNGHFESVVDHCGEQVNHTKTGWKMKCLNHILQEHNHAINQCWKSSTFSSMWASFC